MSQSLLGYLDERMLELPLQGRELYASIRQGFRFGEEAEYAKLSQALFRFGFRPLNRPSGPMSVLLGQENMADSLLGDFDVDVSVGIHVLYHQNTLSGLPQCLVDLVYDSGKRSLNVCFLLAEILEIESEVILCGEVALLRVEIADASPSLEPKSANTLVLRTASSEELSARIYTALSQASKKHNVISTCQVCGDANYSWIGCVACKKFNDPVCHQAKSPRLMMIEETLEFYTSSKILERLNSENPIGEMASAKCKVAYVNNRNEVTHLIEWSGDAPVRALQSGQKGPFWHSLSNGPELLSEIYSSRGFLISQNENGIDKVLVKFGLGAGSISISELAEDPELEVSYIGRVEM